MTQCIRLSAVSTSISQIDASCSACFEFYQKRQQQTLCLRQRRIQDYAFILRTHGPADHCSLKFCAISFITSSSPIFFANGFGPLNRIFWIFLKKIHSSGEFWCFDKMILKSNIGFGWNKTFRPKSPIFDSFLKSFRSPFFGFSLYCLFITCNCPKLSSYKTLNFNENPWKNLELCLNFGMRKKWEPCWRKSNNWYIR